MSGVAGSRRGARTQRQTAWLVGVGLVALLALSFGITFVIADSGDDGSVVDDAAPPTSVVSSAPEEGRLTSASRLGYAGLGPIKLGMTIEEAERAGQTATANTGCGLTFDLGSDTGLRYGDIHVYDDADGAIVALDIATPTISTISGIHIGSTSDDVYRTYANAVDIGGKRLQIENPQGRRITFVVGRDGTVIWMSLHGPEPAPAIDPQC